MVQVELRQSAETAESGSAARLEQPNKLRYVNAPSSPMESGSAVSFVHRTALSLARPPPHNIISIAIFPLAGPRHPQKTP